MTTLLTAPERKEVSGPSVFLVGPITNAQDWQKEATRLLLPHANVFNPRRPLLVRSGQDQDEVDFFDEQVEWELEHQEKADLIVAWLANSIDPNSPRLIGRTTRVEVGWHVGRGKPMVVGIEPGFPGEKYFHKFLKRYAYRTFTSLGETCQAAIGYVQGVSA